MLSFFDEAQLFGLQRTAKCPKSVLKDVCPGAGEGGGEGGMPGGGGGAPGGGPTVEEVD